MATAHLKECVQLLLQKLHGVNPPGSMDIEESLVATFELIEQPWDFDGRRDALIWREGYEQCMKDIVDAIADEWGVTLPPDPLRSQENIDEGEGQ